MIVFSFISVFLIYSVNIADSATVTEGRNVTLPHLGEFHIKKDLNNIENQIDNTQIVTFHLHTRKNLKDYQEINETSLNESYFDPNKMTIVTIHGFLQGKDSDLNYGEHSAWLNIMDCNAIAVDYPTGRLDLISAVMSQPQVAKRIASFIDFLVKNVNVNLNRVIFVGHSLGGNICGLSSRLLTTGKVLAIIAADPGNPLATGLNAYGVLRKDDARYTECITTDGGRFGSIEPLCQATFYVNGGLSQLQCGFGILGLCSHQFSITYHIEALRFNNFESYECKNQISAILGICKTLSKNRLGDIRNIYNNITGIYFTPVNINSPYGKASIQSDSQRNSANELLQIN